MLREFTHDDDVTSEKLHNDENFRDIDRDES